MEPYVSCHLLYGICVKIFIMNRYISKSYTTSKNTIDRQYTEREPGTGAAVVSTITSYISIYRIWAMIFKGFERISRLNQRYERVNKAYYIKYCRAITKGIIIAYYIATFHDKLRYFCQNIHCS